MSKWDKFKQVIGIPDDTDDIIGVDEELDNNVETAETGEKIKRDYRSVSKTPVSSVNKGQVNMVIIRSNDYSDARTVADHILSNRAVLLNLENCNKEMAQRILDFLSGVVYSQGGDLQRVAHSTYAVTPRNVGLQGELAEEYSVEEF